MIFNYRKKKLHLITMAITAVILTACGNAATPEPTVEVQTVETPSIETIDNNNENAESAFSISVETAETISAPDTIAEDESAAIIVLPITPGEENTEMITRNTAPDLSDNNHDLPSLPLTELSAAIPPTATVPASVGDKASYQSQTPLDNAHVERGSEFDVTWFLMNTGSTTWTESYCLRYFTGTNFTKPGKNRYYLSAPVPPNTVGACTIDALAPEEPGTYKMSVVLGNEDDKNFFIVDITIVVD